MNMNEKINLVQELDELYGQLQKRSLNLNHWLAQTHKATKNFGRLAVASPADIPNPLSEEFTQMLFRYKQAQERFIQLSNRQKGFCPPYRSMP